jgi:hypothetical protein
LQLCVVGRAEDVISSTKQSRRGNHRSPPLRFQSMLLGPMERAMHEPTLHPPVPPGTIPVEREVILMQGVWERNRGSVGARVELLEKAVRAIESGRLDNDLSREGRRAAHTLAGSLAMFGFAEGGLAAADLECLISHHCGADGTRARAALDRLRADLAGALPTL